MSCVLTHFGEIIETSSRAFWGDFNDETEDYEGRSKLEWDYTCEPTSADLLVLIEGYKIGEFAEQVILKDSQELCRISNNGVSLHKLNGKSQILGLLEEKLVNSAEVADLLLPFCNLAKGVVTITIRPKVEYKSESVSAVTDEITFIRALTSGLKNVELETPNFIAGAAAGICSYRDIKNMPIISYVAYTDKFELDALSSSPILKLLSEIGVECAESYTPKQQDESHLYM